MGEYVVDLAELDATQTALGGGKAAMLGELSRIEDVRVPDGFCVTTGAFRAAAGHVAIPADIRAAIATALRRWEGRTRFAVRSSATAEDLPGASFAGQYDSYLNVIGTAAVLEHVRRCWSSLLSDGAVAYRRRNGLDTEELGMAVIVQQMVEPDSAGVLFTADPATSNRKVASVEAVPGLGEVLVSGQATPDTFTVRGGEVIARAVQDRPALADEQVVRLVELGRRIEAHVGRPQDIEWCLSGDEFWIVQSRPITTLFPVPEATDEKPHVYLSVGHQQMMTDAMRPLGYSMWQRTAMAPMVEAGGRLFVDAAPRLATSKNRASLLEVMQRDDPITGDALNKLIERGDFLPAAADDESAVPPRWAATAQIDTDPAIVAGLIERNRASLAALRTEIETKSGPPLFDFLDEAFEEHKRVLADPLSLQAIMAGMQATWWLNGQLEEWLGERNAADALTLSVSGNVTSEMGLDLLEVADVVRARPRVVEVLQRVEDDDNFLPGLAEVDGGGEAEEAIRAYLERYGMRCVGEIDITRPRWSERPAALVPLILDNVRNFAPGEAERRLGRGRQAAITRERELLERLRAQPDGAERAAEAKRMIDRVRTFSGYREYPKYGIVSRYFVYKQALLREADRLVAAGALRDREDIFYLTLAELREVSANRRADRRLIEQRRREFHAHQALTAPRVITSEGEVITGVYRRECMPGGAMPGLPVSAGTVEGPARVIRDIAEADLQPGDILVTTYTDPSWTPAFLAASGLVTEVGGLMTHGSVIAREYGLPAVVGVQDATSLIRDGQRIRVNGTDGYVEVLTDPDQA